MSLEDIDEFWLRRRWCPSGFCFLMTPDEEPRPVLRELLFAEDPCFVFFFYPLPRT